MKFRNILPVAVLSVLVLAFVVAYSGDVANAQASSSAVSASNSDNANYNHNLNEVRVEITFDPSGLDFESNYTTVWHNENWFNDSIVKDGAFKDAIGVVQPAIVSGSDNSVRQTALAVYFDNNLIIVGDTTTTNM